MFAFEMLAEERIREAQRKGEFDDLEGAGKPLQLEDDSMIPPELRMAYKILKNAGCLPPEAQIRKDITTALDLLEAMDDERERYQQIQKLNYLVFKMKDMRAGKISIDAENEYYQSVVERLSVKRKNR